MRYDELQDEIKNAMRAKDKPKLSILRQVHGEIKNIEVNERRDITDADVDAMLKRLIKQTKETLDGSIKAGNDQERTDTLTAQVAILESYLPKQVSGDELAALIDEVLTETGASPRRTWAASWAPSPRRPAATSTRRPPPRSWARSWRSPSPPHQARRRASCTPSFVATTVVPRAIRGTAEAVKPNRFFIGRKGNPARRPRSLRQPARNRRS